MRHVLASAALLLATTGCHFPATSQPLTDPWNDRYDGRYGDRYDDRYDRDSRSGPLRANVWYDEYTGVASFDLSRPGHVALFAVRPFGRMEMIYPTGGYGYRNERVFHDGRHSVRTVSRYYHLTRGASRFGPVGGPSGQTYIVLIASDRPLRLDPFYASGSVPWLDRASVTWNPFVAAEHLAREVVSGRRGAEWTGVPRHVARGLLATLRRPHPRDPRPVPGRLRHFRGH